MKKFVIVVCINLLLIGGMVGFVYAEPNNQPELREAPAWQQISAEKSFPFQTGLRRSSELPWLKGEWPVPPLREPLPISYDGRDSGGVTPPGDQGGSGDGDCYAFGSIANFQDKILRDRANLAGTSSSNQTFGIYDFSEQHVIEQDWYNQTGTPLPGNTDNNGGTYFQVANLLSKKGTVLEEDYPPSGTPLKYQKTLLDWHIISQNEMADTELLKFYIYNYGPVYSAMNAGQRENGTCPVNTWCETFNNYGYLPVIPEEDEQLEPLAYLGGGELNQLNHAILLLGWDDNQEWETETGETGQGVWIAKNSWGTEWGEGGFFTIAYGSAGIGTNASFLYDWQDYDDDGGILYYDEAGGIGQLGRGAETQTAWGVVRFTPKNAIYATRVEFWTNYPNTMVDVMISSESAPKDFPLSYKSENFSVGLTGQRDNSKKGVFVEKTGNFFPEAGYHSVKLDTPVAMVADNDYLVKVKFSLEDSSTSLPDDFLGPIPIDLLRLPVEREQNPDYQQAAYANLSYMSFDDTNWFDTVADEVCQGPCEGLIAVRLRYTNQRSFILWQK